ncbi:hypothetical protein CDIK_0064 [Cucumispora dikerogammari]|nr:hypothetical protein CDIK_0064 [Cucumispora dikerogammari]
MSKKLKTVQRVKMQRRGAIKLPSKKLLNKRLLKNINKGKCHVPRNQLITENEKLINKQLRELEEIRNKEILKCICESSPCYCFLNINIVLSCSRNPVEINTSPCDNNTFSGPTAASSDENSDINLIIENNVAININMLRNKILILCKDGITKTNELKLTAFLNELEIMHKKQLINKKFFLDKIIINVTDLRINSIHYLIMQHKEHLITKEMLKKFISQLIILPKREIAEFFKTSVFEGYEEFIKCISATRGLNADVFSVRAAIVEKVMEGKLDWQISPGGKYVFSFN